MPERESNHKGVILKEEGRRGGSGADSGLGLNVVQEGRWGINHQQGWHHGPSPLGLKLYSVKLRERDMRTDPTNA